MAMFNRRDFLGTASQAAMLAGGFACHDRALATDSQAVPRPCEPSAWKKHGVVLTGESVPDHWLQNFLCAAEPLGSNSSGSDRWRLWYSVNHSSIPAIVGIAVGVPGETMVRHEAVLSAGETQDAPLAIGNLPDGWRPVGPTHLHLADGRHRLYFWIHANPIVRWVAADSDDGRRYRVVDPLRPCLYHPNDRAVGGQAAVAAGLTRMAKKVGQPKDGEPMAPAALISNDATNVYQLADGSFVLYTIGLMEVPVDDPRYIKEDNVPGWIRVVDRMTSADGLHWGDRRRVIVPDASDPIDQQFYYLAVNHTERGLIGMLGNYRVKEQIVDLEWCYSRDGLQWERPQRTPWLKRGKPGGADSLSIYPGNKLVEHGGRWHLFYTGVNYTHNFRQTYGEKRSTVMHASCASPWQGG